MNMSDSQSRRNEFWNIQGELSIIERVDANWTRLDRPLVNKGRALAIRPYREGDIGLYFSDLKHPCRQNDDGLWFEIEIEDVENEHQFSREEISELCIQRLMKIYNSVLELHDETKDMDELPVIESDILDMQSGLRWLGLML